MNAKELSELLGREDFLREIHHLLWIEPELNRGARDEGWNCRDHALIVAGVVQMLGFKAALSFGHLALVQGPRGETKPLWFNVSPHAWVGVLGAGHYDLSMRLDRVPFGSEWAGWSASSLVADRVVPSDRVQLAWTYTNDEYSAAIEAAMAHAGLNTAIFGCESVSELTAREVQRGLDAANSLLTDRLRTEFGGRQDLHAKAILHLVDLLNGKAKSLIGLPQMDAWRELAGRPGDAVWRVCSRGKLS